MSTQTRSRYTFPRRRIHDVLAFRQRSPAQHERAVFYILWSLREGVRVALLLTTCLPPRGRLSDVTVHRASCSDIFGSGQLTPLQRPQSSCINTVAVSAARCYAKHRQKSPFKCNALICYVPAYNNCSSMTYAKYDATTPVLLFLERPDSSSLAVTYDLGLSLVDMISAAICRSGRKSATMRLTFPSRFDLIASCSS